MAQLFIPLLSFGLCKGFHRVGRMGSAYKNLVSGGIATVFRRA